MRGRPTRTSDGITIRLTEAYRRTLFPIPAPPGGVQISLRITLDLHEMRHYLDAPQIQAVMTGLGQVIAAQK